MSGIGTSNRIQRRFSSCNESRSKSWKYFSW